MTHWHRRKDRPSATCRSTPDGTIAAFRDLGVGRRILIHINNSNPVLLEDSDERRAATAAGWEIAFDGMELAL
jgi:pyrroloquinoline quinone biosynthesis protein B